MGKLTFKKEEKLSGEKSIQELFTKGSSFYLNPFKVITLPSSFSVNRVLVSVPARTFKRAVDRNKIKRRIREAYRINKEKLNSNKKLLIAYIYTAKVILPSALIHEKLILTLAQINKGNEEN